MILKDKQRYNNMEEAARRYSKKTILITGSSGFIGSSLARAFFDIDCHLLLLDINGRIDVPRNVISSVKFIKGDVTRESTWKHSLRGVDFVFHLAALEYARSNFDIYKDLNINVLAVISLLEVCRINNYKGRIIFSSSANLFGLTTFLPVNEKVESRPVSLWSAHKLLAENYFNIYAAKYGIRAVILRLTNIYGPAYNKKAADNAVINRVIADALAGRNLCLYRNSDCRRDYLYIDDVVRGFLLAGISAGELPEKGYYVIGSGKGIAISQAWKIVTHEVERKIGLKVKIRMNRKIKLEPFDCRNFVADSRLFSEITGWKSLTVFKNGIRSTVASMLSFRSNYGSKKQ